MLSINTFFFMTSIIVVVQSQTWIGNYTADSTCSTSLCCCLSGQIVVTHPSTNTLSMTSGLSGQCGGLTTFSGNTSYPSGYTGYLNVGGQNLTPTLSSDSNTIAAVNPTNSACNGNAKRNSASKQLGNSMAMFVLIFIGFTKIIY